MNPRIAANQQRHFLGFLGALRAHVRRDTALPRRIKEMLAQQRALGSRDRRLYRELIFTSLRYWPWVEPLLDSAPGVAAKLAAWLAADLRDTHDHRAAICADWPPVPPTLAEKIAILKSVLPQPEPLGASLLPEFFRRHSPEAFTAPNLDALLSRAPLWVRLQADDREMVLGEFRRRGWTWREEPDVPDALLLPANADVGGTDAYRRGFVEIQDLGSQLILHHVPVRAGERWLDACAGAGGKTLQLARVLRPAGAVDATDIRPEALEELRGRVQRARLDNNVDVVAQPGRDYDGVLVDAPCSGSGTWRRAPHLKWTTTEDGIVRAAELQLRLLGENSARVRPGGLLVYATCSLSRTENHDVVAAFLAEHPAFTTESPARAWGGAADGLGHTLLPATRDTDGFYVALLRRHG